MYRAREQMNVRGLLNRAQRVPLRLKLLLGCLTVLLLAGAGTWVLVRSAPELVPGGPVVVFGILGVVGLSVFHVVFVPRALEPIRELERAARAIRAGSESVVEVRRSAFADREMLRVLDVFSATLRETVELRGRLHGFAMRALEVGEEQMREISGQLHDDIAQRLAGLVMRLRVVEQTEDPEERQRLLTAVRGEARGALEEVRLLARELRTPELDDLGLGPALRAFGRSLAERSDLEIDFDLAATNGYLTSGQKIGLYRILQEALYNTARHAGAGRVEVRVAHRDGRVVAEAADDGVGFDPAVMDPTDCTCFGLLAMRERARYLGGDFQLETRPGEGTVVRVEIPDATGGPEASSSSNRRTRVGGRPTSAGER